MKAESTGRSWVKFVARCLRGLNRYSTGRDLQRDGKVSGAGKILACTARATSGPKINKYQ